jgi:hypothetical protein
MNKNVKYYERLLKKKVTARTGKEFEEFLQPQLHVAALCLQMLEKVHEELMDGKLVTPRQGSKEQWYDEVNPLMPTYKELQRTIVLHYEALGLNYKSRPKNITDNTKKGGTEQDRLLNTLEAIK